MLVLSRQRDESIQIGPDITVTIVDIRGDKVRLGIVAPKHIPVHRQEVVYRIEDEEAVRHDHLIAFTMFHEAGAVGQTVVRIDPANIVHVDESIRQAGYGQVNKVATLTLNDGTQVIVNDIHRDCSRRVELARKLRAEQLASAGKPGPTAQT